MTCCDLYLYFYSKTIREVYVFDLEKMKPIASPVVYQNDWGRVIFATCKIIRWSVRLNSMCLCYRDISAG